MPESSKKGKKLKSSSSRARYKQIKQIDANGKPNKPKCKKCIKGKKNCISWQDKDSPSQKCSMCVRAGQSCSLWPEKGKANEDRVEDKDRAKDEDDQCKTEEVEHEEVEISSEEEMPSTKGTTPVHKRQASQPVVSKPKQSRSKAKKEFAFKIPQRFADRSQSRDSAATNKANAKVEETNQQIKRIKEGQNKMQKNILEMQKVLQLILDTMAE
ncbi:MAG: hypothetical protein M4579_007484 [Chaenotheca gracillima]|nr:MAG: hypothetical protein M4579_007484 [Chaenotheca gracillima]